MKLDSDMDLLRSLSDIRKIARSPAHSQSQAIDACDRIANIASDAFSFTLDNMIAEAKASADETIERLRRR